MLNKIYNHLEDIDSSKIRIQSQVLITKMYLEKHGLKEPEIIGYYIPLSNPRVKIGVPKGLEDLDGWKQRMEVKYKSTIKL